LVASCTALPHGSVSSQYHAQDGHEGFSYGYQDENSHKHETKVHGITSGGYTYKDGAGHTQSVQYTADPKEGFKIVSATNLPKAPVDKHATVAVAHEEHEPKEHSYDSYEPIVLHKGLPVDTLAVQHAKAEHLAVVAEAKAHSHDEDSHEEYSHEEPKEHSYHSYEPLVLHKGLPVDTVAVQHAKAEHLAVVAEAKAHSHEEHKPKEHAHHEYESVVLHKGLPVDTPAVQHAKEIHFAAIAEAKKESHEEYVPKEYSHHTYEPVTLVKGLPVDTPAVKHAKAIHFAIVAEAKEKSHDLHKRSAPFSYSSVAYHPHDVPVSKYQHKEEHIPVIHKGVPVDTLAVQHAKAEHLAAHAHAGVYNKKDEHYAEHYSHQDEHDIKYDGQYGYHIPVIKNGVPEDTIAVQHARAEHFEAISKAAVYDDSDDGEYKHEDEHKHVEEYAPEYHTYDKYDGSHGYHIPVIKNGVPVDTVAVQHAKAEHYAAVAKAESEHSYGHWDHKEKSHDNEHHW
jgi:hypothetical protein